MSSAPQGDQIAGRKILWDSSKLCSESRVWLCIESAWISTASCTMICGLWN
jgi:hypothetical protein